MLVDPALVARTIGWLHRAGPLQSEPWKLVGNRGLVKPGPTRKAVYNRIARESERGVVSGGAE
jgi:hypothetical protein